MKIFNKKSLREIQGLRRVEEILQEQLEDEEGVIGKLGEIAKKVDGQDGAVAMATMELTAVMQQQTEIMNAAVMEMTGVIATQQAEIDALKKGE